jgi:hypothetical protein
MDIGLGRITPQDVASFQQQGFGTRSCGANASRETGKATPHDQHIHGKWFWVKTPHYHTDSFSIT